MTEVVDKPAHRNDQTLRLQNKRKTITICRAISYPHCPEGLTTLQAITTYLCNIYDRLIKNVDDGQYTHMVHFFDLTKRSIQLIMLELDKMHHLFEIRGIANQLLKSYLSDREQYTKVLNHKSKMAKIAYGVSQGLSLGPLLFLFLLYVNNLQLANKFETTLFADDTFGNL